jgi:hypothetical protein
MWSAQAARPEVVNRLVELMRISMKGITTDRICGIVREYDNLAIMDALQYMRDNGIAACASKRWYLRTTRDIQKVGRS